jgi:hypothetical protein
MRGLPGDSESGENPIMPNSIQADADVPPAPLMLAVLEKGDF